MLAYGLPLEERDSGDLGSILLRVNSNVLQFLYRNHKMQESGVRDAVFQVSDRKVCLGNRHVRL